ncbi:hypothetical protein M419DRAFT_8152 [Trichoderma reesei RUT C-30]|uniref:Uncharacterized protein n=1 Tax=Hypocrea jecorina (strain ATCC 56765 / BCRC 32924 / NRRL 11460 / Rut C-30) TaxID=1344414 RepID=A0A024SEA9_HYPJR|nr:hypothetical protein M419DRAFT_8152 [Trichoderma reesei RUT C-30]
MEPSGYANNAELVSKFQVMSATLLLRTAKEEDRAMILSMPTTCSALSLL